VPTRTKVPEKYRGIDPNNLLTPIGVVCERVLNLHPKTGLNLFRRGEFPFKVETIGRRHYCPTVDVLEYIESHDGHKK
jgi:hypothetical protein